MVSLNVYRHLLYNDETDEVYQFIEVARYREYNTDTGREEEYIKCIVRKNGHVLPRYKYFYTSGSRIAPLERIGHIEVK